VSLICDIKLYRLVCAQKVIDRVVTVRNKNVYLVTVFIYKLFQQYLYPVFKSEALEHDSYSCKYYNGVPFPTKRDKSKAYVGAHR